MTSIHRLPARVSSTHNAGGEMHPQGRVSVKSVRLQVPLAFLPGGDVITLIPIWTRPSCHSLADSQCHVSSKQRATPASTTNSNRLESRTPRLWIVTFVDKSFSPSRSLWGWFGVLQMVRGFSPDQMCAPPSLALEDRIPVSTGLQEGFQALLFFLNSFEDILR